MRWFALALAAIIAVVAWTIAHPVPKPIHHPYIVRDSVASVRSMETVRVDTIIRWLPRAPVDTMSAIMRDRARRPVVVLGDTVWMDSTETDTVHDSVCLSSNDARRTILHDVADSIRGDSLRQELRITRSVLDSVENDCIPSSPWRSAGIGFGVGFGIGYGAGIATCFALK